MTEDSGMFLIAVPQPGGCDYPLPRACRTLVTHRHRQHEGQPWGHRCVEHAVSLDRSCVTVESL